jgi:hypothetical protein
VSKHHWGWECELDSSIEVTTLTVEIYNGRVEVTAECSIRDWPDYKIPREQMEMLTAFYWEGSGDRRQLILDLGEVEVLMRLSAPTRSLDCLVMASAFLPMTEVVEVGSFLQIHHLVHCDALVM